MNAQEMIYVILHGYNRWIEDIDDHTFNNFNAARDYLIKNYFNELSNDGAWVQIARVATTNLEKFKENLNDFDDWRTILCFKCGQVFLDAIFEGAEPFEKDELDKFINEFIQWVKISCDDECDEILELNKSDFSNDEWKELLENFNEEYNYIEDNI